MYNFPFSSETIENKTNKLVIKCFSEQSDKIDLKIREKMKKKKGHTMWLHPPFFSMQTWHFGHCNNI